MKDQIKEVRDKLANNDSMDPEEIKKTVNELQQQSLKLFEMAYKKVRRSVLLLFSIDRIGSLSQFLITPGSLLTHVSLSADSCSGSTSFWTGMCEFPLVSLVSALLPKLCPPVANC